MVRESISKMKNGKAAGLSGMASEMVKAVEKGGVDKIADLVNQIMVGVISAEWELCTMVDCYKGKHYSLEIGFYRGLKLTNQILKIAERIIEKLIQQQADTGEMQFGFMPNYFYLEAVTGEISSKKEEFVLCICRFEKSF